MLRDGLILSGFHLKETVERAAKWRALQKRQPSRGDESPERVKRVICFKSDCLVWV